MTSRSAYPDIRSWIRSLPMSALVAGPAERPDSAASPVQVFLDWLEFAVVHSVVEPQVAVLSTVDPDGQPDARMLMLRDVTADGWWFSGPVTSPKGVQLQAEPCAALTFYWPTIGRQVRVRGPVREGDHAIAARDFRDRSVTARAVATASRQSEVLCDAEDYRTVVAAAASALDTDADAVPEHWRAWQLQPSAVEFWQADPGRRHLRWRFSRAVDGWDFAELWP